jgi:hypothetical protein
MFGTAPTSKFSFKSWVWSSLFYERALPSSTSNFGGAETVWMSFNSKRGEARVEVVSNGP